MYRSIVICFLSWVFVLQNEYVSIVKSFKYDYSFNKSLGPRSVGYGVSVWTKFTYTISHCVLEFTEASTSFYNEALTMQYSVAGAKM